MRFRFSVLWGFAVLAAAALIFAPTARVIHASEEGIVFSTVYGGGGNAGATYTHDIIELFNASSAPVTMDGWSLQYASSAGDTWNNRINLPTVTIQPGKYYLVQAASFNVNVGDPLPTTPDHSSDSINMSGGNGKIALVKSQTALSGTNPSGHPSVVDFLGYGTVNGAEGSSTSNLSSTTAAYRLNNGCKDTDDNSVDFAILAVVAPRNSASPANVCNPKANLAIEITESSDVIAPDESVTYTVTVTNGGTAPATLVGINVAVTGTAGPYTIADRAETSGAFCGDNGASTVTCTGITSIGVGDTYAVSFSVSPSAEGVINVDASTSTTATDSDLTNNTDAETTTVQVPQADVTVEIGYAPSPVYSHDTLTVSFTVANGPQAPADSVVLHASFTGAGFEELVSADTSGCGLMSASTLSCNLGTIAANGSVEASVTVAIADAGAIDVEASVEAQAPEVADNNEASETITVLPGCGNPATLIGTYPNVVSPAQTNQTVEGIVVGDFQLAAPHGLNPSGFYLQDEGDGDPSTSDGLYIAVSANIYDVAVGDRVRVTGTVGEQFGQTRMTNVSAIIPCGTGTVAPTTVSLPVANVSDWEAYEGMLVTVVDSTTSALTVTEMYRLHYLGEYLVSSGGRLYNPTTVAEPGTPANAVAAENARRQLVIDDGRDDTNQMPACTVPNMECDDPLNPQGPVAPFRIGSTTPSLTGVLGYGHSAYRLHPTVDATFTNVRPTSVPDVGGRLKVASFNVLNFFNGNGSGGGFTTGDQRGPNTIEEYDRMVAKLVIALEKLDADIIGLMEIENDAAGHLSALADLTEAFNAHLGAEEYAYIETGKIGTDAIKVALIYRTSTVTPQGDYAIDLDSVNSRPTLAQTFTENATGADLTVVVNHFKSKGCGNSSGLDTDQGDGQSCYNDKRVAQAERLLEWLDTDPTDQDDSDILIIGDLNAYAKEDPIDVLLADGYTNLVHLHDGGDAAYGYVFGATSGYLDHALASPSMLSQVTDTAIWHINADEPAGRDYNDTVVTGGGNSDFYQPPELYEVNEFRTSDHDPVLVGVSLDVVAFDGAITAPETVGVGTTGEYTITVADPDLTGPSITVVVTSDAGEEEDVELLEQSAGTYSGAFDVVDAAPVPGNDVIEAQSGDVLTVTYIDAWDADGDADTLRTANTTAVATNMPGAFELVSPDDGEILREDLTAFVWTQSDDTTSYNVLLAKLSNNVRLGEVYEETFAAADICEDGLCAVSSDDLAAAGLSTGLYSWTVSASGAVDVEASNGPNLFTVQFDSIELVSNGSFEDGKIDWNFKNGAKRKCGGFGATTDCALRLKPGASALQSGVMAGVLQSTATAADDVLEVSAMILSPKPKSRNVIVVTLVYVDPTAGANGKGKDKIKLVVAEKTTDYQLFSTTFALDGALKGGKLKVTNNLPSGVLRVDDVSVKLLPVGSTPRRAGSDARGSVLPPPAAPDGFRGNN